ncbi:MAG: Clp protease N-terminal domain-containing protein [Marmoricola sp.]
MLERFTKPARGVVDAAIVHARDARAVRVRPEHLLVALLEDDDGLAARVLTDLGAPPARLLAEVEARRDRYVDGLGDEDAAALATIGIDLEEVLRRVDPEPSEGRPRVRTRFSREAKKVLELSLREAVALHHNYIGTEHILLGLAREGDPLVLDSLGALGVTRKDLRAAVVEAVRKAG